MKPNPNRLPPFHPGTRLKDWGDGDGFHIADALTGVSVFGATGSGKTSGAANHLAYAYLSGGFGGVVLCAKKEERPQWQRWAAECGRSKDLIVFDASGDWRFNILEWENSRKDAGGGFTINIVSILDEIAGALARQEGQGNSGSGSNKFWIDGLHHMNTNLVDLLVLAKLDLSLTLMRSIVNSAPISLDQAKDPTWRKTSVCGQALAELQENTRDAAPEIQADRDEVLQYWQTEYPNLAFKTRSIITLMFSMMVRPLVTRPLRALFSSDLNVKPEDTFEGKIIIVDLPIQDFRLAGRIANLTWKYCFQLSVLSRAPAQNGFLRPVFLWADEAQYFVTPFDAEYQATARSAGGATVYLTQNRESYRRVLGNNDVVDSLLGNLQTKIYAQNAGETNEWASKLLGDRYLDIPSISISHSGSENPNQTSGVTQSQQKRHFVDPAVFTTLKRGGALYNNEVECIVYKGGHLFHSLSGERLPFKKLTFQQR